MSMSINRYENLCICICRCACVFSVCQCVSSSGKLRCVRKEGLYACAYTHTSLLRCKCEQVLAFMCELATHIVVCVSVLVDECVPQVRAKRVHCNTCVCVCAWMYKSGYIRVKCIYIYIYVCVCVCV